MSEASVAMPPADRALSCKAAVIGVGESDYHDDYRAERTRPPGYEPPLPEALAKTAFDRALADSGLDPAQIDGISTSFTYGGPAPREMAAILGVEPKFAIDNGNIMAGPLPIVCAAIARGEADVVAMVYAVASRAIGRQYGGATYSADARMPSSYYYYHPWGWSSQAAHWAMMFTHYENAYSVGEEDLAHVAIRVRENAMRHPSAVMRGALDIEKYMASRYIVRPLHLFDMCLVNDGAVCLIVARAELARDLSDRSVHVAGWGESKVTHDKMQLMVRERLRPQMQDAGAQAFAMAGMELSDIGHFEGYDASTIHLVNQVEGYGFAAPGTGIELFGAGETGPAGRLPVNTGGGNLSGSYMHGWSQVAEAVRQVRGDAGERQVPGLTASLTSLAQTDQAHPLIFTQEPRA